MAYNNNNNNYNQNAPKKSGAKYSTINKGNYIGETIVNAWNVSKNKGLITATVSPYKGSEIVESERNQYMKMIAVVNYENSGVQKVIPCLMNTKTRVISLEEIGMCITPNGSGRTKSGKSVTGYFGTFKRN